MCLTCAEPGENCQKRFQYKSGYKSPFFREKLLWRQSIPMSISHPRNARPRVLTGREEEGWGGGGGGGTAYHFNLLHMSLNQLQSISSLSWFNLFNYFANDFTNLDLVPPSKVGAKLKLHCQTFAICDRNQAGTSNCLWTESVPFDQFQNQFWALVHSKPSEIWRWCHRFYDAIVPV